MMKRTLFLILSVVVVIACMAMPVVASTFQVTGTSMKTQYHNSVLCDQGTLYCKSSGYIRIKVFISHGGGTPHGGKNWTFNDTSTQNHSPYSGWADHDYNCDTVGFQFL